jgi:hypothetical protein
MEKGREKMKELQRKKILKEAGVLLIAIVMVLSTVAVTANTNDESPEFMLAGADDISQSPQTNTFDPDWIHFDGGININSLGLTAGGALEGAVRITPTESSFGKNKAALHPSENPPFTVNNGYHEGWPQIIIGTPNYWGGIISPVVADLDNDGSKELIVTQQGEPSRLYVFEQNGSLKFDVIEMPSAFPFINPRCFSSIDDIDNDGFKEIIFETKGYNEYRFMIYSQNGTLKDEWNIGNYQVSDSLYASIVLADLDFDNAMEIIYGGWVGGTGNDGPSLVVLDNEGNYKPGFPVRLEYIQMAETNTPAVGNFDEDADLEIVVISHENNQPVKKTNIRVFDTNGSLLWAQELDSIVYGDPAVGDINHDGFDEVVFTSPKGVHILDRHGEYLVNKYLGHDNGDSSNIALADLDGDKNLEVIFGYFASIYVMNHSGYILWSSDTGWNAHYPPVVGDITGDGIPDIVATSDFEVWAWNSQGELLSGFPKDIEINAYGACSLDDIDNDGYVELIASSDWKWNGTNNEGYIYVWDTPGIYNSSTVEWPMYQHDMGHTGLYSSDEFIANAGGPYTGMINEPVQFNGTVSGGFPPYLWLWEFGDGNTSEEQNPPHTYSEADTYTVTLTVTDSTLNNSDDDTTTATIMAAGEPRLEIGTITGGLFKVDVVIKNTGGIDALAVNWSITLDGGFILAGKETPGRIAGISAGGEVAISSGFILGFGKTVITVSAETANSSDTVEQDAFVLLFFIKM